jgi:hypothetical protein
MERLLDAWVSRRMWSPTLSNPSQSSPTEHCYTTESSRCRPPNSDTPPKVNILQLQPHNLVYPSTLVVATLSRPLKAPIDFGHPTTASKEDVAGAQLWPRSPRPRTRTSPKSTSSPSRAAPSLLPNLYVLSRPSYALRYLVLWLREDTC